ncbi:MAG: metallophosphoesterase [Akkermansiaceae bacterium]|nr:metallophosphoesterase [Akkermansiaceae bacterium]
MEKGKRKLFSRRNFIATGALGAVGSYTYARYIEPNRLTVTQKEIRVPHLPAALDGLIVAQLTDFHYEPDRQHGLIQEAVEATNAAEPDIIALTGDFITGSQTVFDPLMATLSGLKAKHGIYTILGNHDGWHGSIHGFQSGFRKSGFEFLVNQGTRINIKGENLYIIGTDSVWSGHVDAPACYRGYHKAANEPVLALVHEPDVFDTLTDLFPVSLQLSGHTHGGQCRVPLIGYAPVKVRFGRNYIYGEYAKGDSRIFVSRGLGTVGIPVRFACPPEIAILTLRA